MVCGRCSVSNTILAGMLSMTHMRCAANPARAGSVRKSGDGPSLTRHDLPGSRSRHTILRAALTPSGNFRSGSARMMGSWPCANPTGPSRKRAAIMS